MISNIIWSIVNSELMLAGAVLKLRISPTARRLRLKVNPRNRSLLLTMPRRMSERRALAWAAEQGDWAAKALAALPARVAILPGATIPVEGVAHVIDWSADRSRRIILGDRRLVVGGPQEGLENRVLRWLKARARDVLTAETRSHGARIGAVASRIGIGDPVSRWGSCASNGAIRYSWRLILAPPFVRQATVAHEVAHLIHMNHGPDFHALVETALGCDPTPARDWLRREGAALHQIGPSG